MIRLNDFKEMQSNRLWTEHLPRLAKLSLDRGPYTVRDEEAIRACWGQEETLGPVEAALCRLELATWALWDDVEFLFEGETFPHLLYAATDVLRATDFSETPGSWLHQRQLELAAAMDGAEQVLAPKTHPEQGAKPEPPCADPDKKD